MISRPRVFSNPDQISEKAIFHLHGQRDGFVLLNTRAEVTKHRGHIQPVFEDAHKGRIWIVVGYSGENDGIRSAREGQNLRVWPVLDRLWSKAAEARRRQADWGGSRCSLYRWMGCGRLLCHARSKASVLSAAIRHPAFLTSKGDVLDVDRLQRSRNDSDDAPDFRQSRFDVASVVRPQLDSLIRSREQALSAEYFFLSGEYERAAHRLEKASEDALASDADTYGSSILMLGDRVAFRCQGR